jgi:hypothetical protein
MSESLGSAVLELSTVDKGFKSGLDTAENLTKKAAGAMSHAIEGITSSFGKVVDGFAKFGLAANGVKALGESIAGVSKTVLGGNAQFEDYNVQFSTLIKNSEDFKQKYSNITDPLERQALAAQAAKDKMAELARFGATTPFDLPQVVEAQRVLMGFGLAADNAKTRFGQAGSDILRIAGDVSSGTGAGFQEIALDIGKFSAGATGEAISRFQELGITTRDELSKMGLAFDKGGALIVHGQADMDHATSILLSVMKNKYGGLMDAQSATFNGMMSNLQDWADGTIRTMTQPLFEPAKAGLKAFLDFTGSPAGQQAVKKLTGYVQTGVDTISKLFKDAKTPVQTFLAAFQGKEVDGIKGFDTTAGRLATTFGMLASKAVELYQKFSPLTTVFDVLKGFATGGLEGGLKALEQRIEGMGAAFGLNLTPFVTEFNAFLKDTLIPTFNTVAGFVTGTLVPALMEIGKWVINEGLPRFLSFASSVASVVIPIFGEVVKFVTTVLIPALGEFAKWVVTNLGPVVKGIGDVFTKDVLPAIGRFAEFIKTSVIPAVQSLFKWIGETLVPMVEKFIKVLSRMCCRSWVRSSALFWTRLSLFFFSGGR